MADSNLLEQRSFYSLLFLAQAFGDIDSVKSMRLCVVTNDMQQVTGEEKLCAEKALVIGPCRVVTQELPELDCRSIDVSGAIDGAWIQRTCDQLIAEAALDDSDPIVAYRGQYRWVQTFEQLHLSPTDGRPLRLKEDSVVLITSGLGGMALALAEYLTKTARAKLILMGRSALPPRELWAEWLATHEKDEQTSRRISRVQALERMGASVLVLTADVADVSQVQAAVDLARERFGEINGVIHTAGVAGGGVVQLKTPEMAARVLSPKVRGVRVLEQVLGDMPLDFFALCSSRGSILGGFGQVDYCAGNAFLDAFAHEHARRHSGLTVSIDWDAWAEVGMLVDTAAQYGLLSEQKTAERDHLHPLLDRYLGASADEETFVTTVSPATHWVLDDHRIVGTAIMPGTAYLEMARAALEQQHRNGDENSVVEIRDAFFLSPLGLRNDETCEVRTVLKKTAMFTSSA